MKVRSVCSFMRFTNGGNVNVLFAISLVGVTDLGKCNRQFFFIRIQRRVILHLHE